MKPRKGTKFLCVRVFNLKKIKTGTRISSRFIIRGVGRLTVN